ncbi:hypothetical protein VXQ18_05905 [Brucella abortus]|nr:hypothetical protein [Brucella abortus]
MDCRFRPRSCCVLPSAVSVESHARMTIPASPAAFAEVNGIEMYYRVVGEGRRSC